jgi:hypothetical protein
LPPRWAVYYVPDAGTPLYEAGSRLLGRFIREGRAAEEPLLSDVNPRGAFTAKPALYGFHSTIIAPFRTDRSRGALVSEVQRAVKGVPAFPLPKLRLSLLSGFPALAAHAVSAPFMRLEKALLERLSPMFLPPDPASLARRGRLSPRQLDYFWKWGYPFVLDQHRFHLTLGAPGAPDEYIRALKGLFPPETLEGLTLSKVTLCLQEKEGEPFGVVRDFPLSPAEALAAEG